MVSHFIEYRITRKPSQTCQMSFVKIYTTKHIYNYKFYNTDGTAWRFYVILEGVVRPVRRGGCNIYVINTLKQIKQSTVYMYLKFSGFSQLEIAFGYFLINLTSC